MKSDITFYGSQSAAIDYYNRNYGYNDYLILSANNQVIEIKLY